MPFLLWYLLAANLVAVMVTVIDKISAGHHQRRIPERTLLTVAAFGGAPLMLLSMVLIRHKTRKPKFMVGIPLIVLVQAALLVAYYTYF